MSSIAKSSGVVLDVQNVLAATTDLVCHKDHTDVIPAVLSFETDRVRR